MVRGEGCFVREFCIFVGERGRAGPGGIGREGAAALTQRQGMRTSAMNRRILGLAAPAVVSNVTVPLLGLVDVTIVGHLGDAAYIGAIAAGGMLFNVLFWIFGFLRMGTSGLTSQAYGRGDEREQARVLAQALATGLLLSAAVVSARHAIGDAAFRLLGTSPEVERHAERYFYICVWGVPAMLGMYAFNGWFVGMQNSRFPMWVSVGVAAVNTACSLGLVLGFGMKVEGVAAGTVAAEWFGLGLAAWLWARRYGRPRGRLSWREFLDVSRAGRFFAVNRDIFLRTLCLVAVTFMFTSRGARQGDTVLAVNTLLMQLFTLFSYVMDGFAYAGEALTGRYAGARDLRQLRAAAGALFRWGAWTAAAFTCLYAAGGEGFLRLLTSEEEVVAAAGEYFWWAVGIPAAGFAAFLWDGILVGATATGRMLASMALATAVFFAVYLAGGEGNNHALWGAFLAYLFTRGAAQSALGRRVLSAGWLLRH